MKTVCLFGFAFRFELLETQEISHSLNFNYIKLQPLGGYVQHQSTGEWEENISLSGTLVVESVNRLQLFEILAKFKVPVRFTVPTGESFMVVIMAMRKTKKEFVFGGGFVRQEYNIEMERNFDTKSTSFSKQFQKIPIKYQKALVGVI